MQTIEADAKGLGTWQLELFAEMTNTRAVAFYRRLGHEQAGRLPNDISGPNGGDFFLTSDLR